MTRDDIIRMAREAGFVNLSDQYWDCTTEGIERFAALVAAAEREECAKLCEEGGKDESGRIHVQAWGAAKDIRARGVK